MSPTTVPSAGGRLVTLDGRELPLRATRLQADCAAGLGRVELEQVFYNPHAEPLRVTYQVPLPAEAAVTGYRFRFGDDEVVGRVDRKETARARFEEAILEGRTAALLEEDRSSLFTQEVGNIPAGSEVIITITVDQKLIWAGEGWEWRFPTVVGPRYLGTPGRVPDAAKVATTTTTDPLGVAVGLELTIRDANVARDPNSTSHALSLARGRDLRVGFASEHAALDRDVVVQWTVAAARPGVGIDVMRPAADHARAGDAFALLTVVPPTKAAAMEALPRDLIVLLDTSGSMGGQPLDQAKKVVASLIDGMGERDRLELIEFSMRPRSWQSDPVFATASNRVAAQRWLASLRAGGGTEMKEGLLAAMSGLRDEAQRQVVLVSDGYIGFEAEIVGAILDGLPAGSRMHTVGVGSAVNRSLTQPSARAGRGVEIVIGVDEDPERATQRLVAATGEPVLVDLSVTGDALLDVAPLKPHDLYAGAPALLSARLKPEGGTLLVHGRSAIGAWEQRLSIPATGAGQGNAAVAALYAREAVEDLELRRAAGHADLDPLVERYGLDFQISTRLTSWVAISRARTVDPTKPTRNEVVPHALPHGTSVAGFGLRKSDEIVHGYAPAQAFAGTAGGANRKLGRTQPSAAAPRMRAAKPSRGQSPADTEGGRQESQAESPAGPAKDKADLSVDSLTVADRDAFDEEMDDGLLEQAAPPSLLVDPGPLKMRGAWKRVGDRWVFTFVAPEGGFDWARPDAVDVLLADGTTHSLALHRSSTEAGIVDAGATIRLVIVFPTELAPQTPVAFAVGDEMQVELDA